MTLRVGRQAEGAFQSVELLLAALGSCMLGTMLAFAENVGVPIDGAKTTLTPSFADGPERVSGIEIRLRIDGEIEPKRLASLRRAAEHCKVHSTLAHAPQLDLVLET